MAEATLLMTNRNDLLSESLSQEYGNNSYQYRKDECA